ncbi:hypothetical protein [Cyanobium sp. Candia 9D4]|uniref:hypothetical protein n=1 Tax=Cyanobium sp. Candia 9D4 TaxID=2823707 RepID=UPI0037BE2851
MQLYSPDGRFDQLVLIREFRAGSDAAEAAPASAEQLLGRWQGQSATISADWHEADTSDVQLELGHAELEALRLLPDGGFVRLPEQVSQGGLRAGGRLAAGPGPDGAPDPPL